jgi:hypothetical protein
MTKNEAGLIVGLLIVASIGVGAMLDLGSKLEKAEATQAESDRKGDALMEFIQKSGCYAWPEGTDWHNARPIAK